MKIVDLRKIITTHAEYEKYTKNLLTTAVEYRKFGQECFDLENHRRFE